MTVITDYEVKTPADLKGELATIAELHEFIDKVRAAAGISPLGSLAPSVPMDASNCLIAKNVGTEVSVEPVGRFHSSGARQWILRFGEYGGETDADHTRAGAVVNKLGLEWADHGAAVKLPERIGNIAEAFDAWAENPQAWPKFNAYVEQAYKEANHINPEARPA